MAGLANSIGAYRQSLILARPANPRRRMIFVDRIGHDRESWLARRDARLKLAWLGAVSLASVLIDSAPALLRCVARP